MNSTRRSVLTAIGTGTIVGAAGCLGGDEIDTSYDCSLDAPDPVSSMDAPVLGDSDAPVTVQVFEDFSCPHCATFSTAVLPQLESEYVDAGDAHIVHRDFPIPVSDEWSYEIASAARSVQDSAGNEAFFAFSKAMYESIDNYSWQLVGDEADGLDADPCTTIAAGSNRTYEAVSDADRERGTNIGISGTPGIVVEGSIVGGYDSVEESYGPIANAIDAELQ